MIECELDMDLSYLKSHSVIFLLQVLVQTVHRWQLNVECDRYVNADGGTVKGQEVIHKAQGAIVTNALGNL